MLRRLVVRWTRLLAVLFRGDLLTLRVGRGAITTRSGLTETCLCGMRCSGPVPGLYLYGPYGDVYGGYAYGPTRTPQFAARRVTPETTGSVTDSADLAQSCGGLAPGVTDLPIDKIQQSLQLSNRGATKSLNALKAASSQASDALDGPVQAKCNSPTGTPRRCKSGSMAWCRRWVWCAPLDDFYNSLNDGQRQRFGAGAGFGRVRTAVALLGRQPGCAVQQGTRKVSRNCLCNVWNRAVKPTQQRRGHWRN